MDIPKPKGEKAMKRTSTLKKTQRYERRLAAAREDCREIMEAYKQEIRQQEIRRDASKNGFVKTCCQQEIDQLKAEMDAIEMEVVG